MYQLMYVMHLIWLKYILQFHMPLKIFFTERLHLKTLSQVVTLQLCKDTFILHMPIPTMCCMWISLLCKDV